MGDLQVGQIRRESIFQVPGDSGELQTLVGPIRTRNIQTSVQRIEEGRQDFISPFNQKSRSDVLGRSGILLPGDTSTDRTHSNFRSLPSSEKICRPISKSTGISSTNQDVSSPSDDIRSRLGEEPALKSFTTTLPDPNHGLLPTFMVSSSLNLSHIPKGLLEKCSTAIQLDEVFSTRGLEFTEAERRFLESSEPDPEIVFHQILESSGTKKKLKWRINGERVTTVPRRGPCALPLAPITTQRINYENLLNLTLPPSEELMDALSWIRTDRLKKCVLSHPMFLEERLKVSHHVSRYLAEDMLKLHQQGIFKLSPWGESSIEVPLFKVPKAGDAESRLIGDARSINRLLPRPGPMGLPDLPTLVRKLLHKRVLFQLDARSYFYAFGLGKESSEVFSVRWGYKRGSFHTSRWEVMPQGWNMAPRIAQHSSLHVADNSLINHPEALLIPWVDNFLAGADDGDEMQLLLSDFREVCRRCNIEIKPTTDVPGTTMDALGIHFDVSSVDILDHYVELQEEFRQQMKRDYDLIASNMTPRQYFQVFGGCMWANYAVGRHPLCRWSDSLSMMREMAICVHREGRSEAWDEPITVAHHTVVDLQSMVKSLMNARRTLRDLQQAPPTVDIFTDASRWALGYLRIQPTLAGTHRTHNFKDIFLAELLAACEAWFSAADSIPNLHVDNTAAVGAIMKGHSSTAKGNLILSRLYESLPGDSRAWLTTVPTECQRADLLSRGLFAAGTQCSHHHSTRLITWSM